jgi:hypothetical protein
MRVRCIDMRHLLDGVPKVLGFFRDTHRPVAGTHVLNTSVHIHGASCMRVAKTALGIGTCAVRVGVRQLPASSRVASPQALRRGDGPSCNQECELSACDEFRKRQGVRRTPAARLARSLRLRRPRDLLRFAHRPGRVIGKWSRRTMASKNLSSDRRHLGSCGPSANMSRRCRVVTESKLRGPRATAVPSA